MNFLQISLPDVPKLQAKELLKLANNSDNNGSFAPPTLPNEILQSSSRLPRTIDEIILDIEKKQFEQISLLEWIYCLHTKSQWDEQNPDKSQETSEAIWKIAEHNLGLKYHLFWHLARYYDDLQHNLLATSLVISYSSFVPTTEKDRLVLEIIQVLKSDRPAYNLAKLSWKMLFLPDELLSKNQLPQKLSISESALNYTVHHFSAARSINIEQIDWLLCCFARMSKQQQIRGVEYLLTSVSQAVGENQPKLVNWLRQNYGSGMIGSRWNELSSQAKIALRKWIGAVNYNDFQKLVDLLLRRLPLEDRERNQLEKRKGFWANYSDRFERIRILLPQSSFNVLNAHFSNQDVNLLSEDGSKATEVCIFDFGDRFVVEFFRGPGSETRVFKRDPRIEQELFQSLSLSIKRLRCLGGEVHDHVFCWQHYCEKWLREVNNIYPNEGTVNFKGLSSKYNQYNRNTGLLVPSLDDLEKRQRQKNWWEYEIQQLEREAIDYCRQKQDF